MMRLFLTSQHFGLFADVEPAETREQFLRRVFGSEINFRYRQKQYVYRYFDSGLPNLITGAIGKQHLVTLGDAEFKRKPYLDWQSVNVLIDPSGDHDGQKVAMQNVKIVGPPIHVFRALTDHINFNNRNSDWNVVINVISSENEFWDAVKKYEGSIGEADFNFVTPNIWGGTTETENALRKLQDQNNAQEVEVRLKNPDKNLNLDSQDIKDSVEYITKGAVVLC